MNRTARTILAIFFIAVIGVSAISISHSLFKNKRLDITENELYTLSDGTKQILANLKQPITMKLFYTKTAAMKAPDQIRFYNNYYTYVRALLEEYEAQAKGNLNLEIIDPRPYSEEELAAIRYGLRRFNITEDENFFFGLVVQTQFGVTKIIDFFTPDRQQFVEYDISYLIDTAITRQKKRLGILSSLDIMGDTDYMARMKQMQGQQPNRKWGIVSHLEKQYEISTVPADTDEISDVDLLMVVHPKDLPEKTQFAIDQFILNGGRAIVCVDPHCVADPPDMQQQYGMGHDSSSNLPKLLKAWGLEMPDETFVGDRILAMTGATRPNTRPEKIIPFIKMTSAYDCFNTDNTISASLNEVSVIFAGALKVLDAPAEDQGPADLAYTPLLTTTKEGNTWKIENPYELMNPDYSDILRRFRDGDKPVTMGYLVTGTFKTAFPEGIQVPDDSAAENEDQTEESTEPKMKTVTGLTEAAQPGAILVLSDVDMISDLVAYQRSIFGLTVVGDNSSLIFNALEDLSGSSYLISIRSRGNYKRPFTKVDEMEAEVEARTAEEEAKIVAQVQGFEKQLNEKLRSIEGENKGELINQTIIEEKDKIELELRKAEKQLRDIKNQKREQVESLKGRLRNYCTLAGPGLMLIISVVLGIRRSFLRRYYISHTSDS